MKLTILYDNSSYAPSFRSGWGFSCLVDGRILFDTGEAPDSLFHNMTEMNIDPVKLDAVVISHDHWDHTGGLWKLLEKRKGLKVYACPGFGAEFQKRVIALEGTLIESDGFQVVDTSIFVTGEIPGRYKGEPMPEQALIVKTSQGLTVITGCSHPGIIAMVERAKTFSPAESIALVLGGFHLKDETRETVESIVSDLIKMGVKSVGPTHCTGENARRIFQDRFGEFYIPVAAGIELEV